MRDTVTTVKFTFEDEKANEVEDDIEDVLQYYDDEEENEDDLEENVFLYDIVTDSPRTARPPLFDSLPMFEKDIFSSTFYQEGEETTVGSDLFASTEISSAISAGISTPSEESGSMDENSFLCAYDSIEITEMIEFIGFILFSGNYPNSSSFVIVIKGFSPGRVTRLSN